MKKHGVLALFQYLSFFALVSFIISCCMILFLSLMSKEINIEFTEENIKTAAKFTFLNVLFLSFVITVIDVIRRKIIVERPVKQIVSVAQRITEGDFSATVSIKGGNTYGFQTIADNLNKICSELGGVETLRTDFIANVSHELKTPLAVIQNYGTMLSQQNITEDERIEYAKAITNSSQKLASLITNILKLNKLENQQIFQKTASYDLSEQLCECLLSFESVWENKNIDIDINIESDIFVNADSELLILVWNNLFSNAFKFTDNCGRVSVKLKTDNEFAVVEVTDTGCGIASETGKHIFEKFYQGDTSHAVQGNGLGLALVKRVIDITGGEISVSSEFGKGSTFIVKIRREENETD